MPRQKKAPRALVIPLVGKWPKVSDAAGKALAFLSERENDSNHDSYFPHGYVTEKGHVKTGKTYVCHADLGDFKKAQALWTLFPHSYQGAVPKKIELKFIDYLMKRSPWKHVPVMLDKNFVWDHGFLVEDMTVPANLMGNFCVVTRMCGERPDAINFWNEMVEAGVNENVALLFALSINTTPKQAYYYSDEMSWSKYDKGHDPFNAFSMTKEYAENFVAGKVADKKEEFGKNPNYRPCNTVWGPCEKHGDSYKKFIYDTYQPAEAADRRMFHVGAQNEKVFPRERWIEVAIAESIRMGVGNVGRKKAVKRVG